MWNNDRFFFVKHSNLSSNYQFYFEDVGFIVLKPIFNGYFLNKILLSYTENMVYAIDKSNCEKLSTNKSKSHWKLFYYDLKMRKLLLDLF